MNPDINNIVLLLIIGIAGMLILALGFITAVLYSQRKKSQHQLELQQLKENQQNLLIEAAVLSEETERHRIAEELHDEVGAILSSTRLHFSSLSTKTMSERDITIHQRSKELLDDSIHKVRTISHNLHSSILKELGLNEAIRHFVQKLTQDTGIEALFELDENYKGGNPDGDISLYRLVQELMNNLLKHAAPKRITISSKAIENKLDIAILHNGNGLTQDQFEEMRYRPDGLGLKNIQNRIILLKGKILFEKTPALFAIYISIPQKNQS